MKHRQNFNPKKHRQMDGSRIIGDNRPSNVDQLFNRIKAIEAENRKNKIGKGENMNETSVDERLKEASEATPERGYRILKPDPEKLEKAGRTPIEKIDYTPEEDTPEYYIASDPKLASLLDYRRILDNFIQMMKQIPDQYSYCCTRVSESDKEVQDYLHELRQPKRNASDGFKLYQLGHYIQIKRQGFKDAQEDLRPLSGFANTYKEEVSKLEKISENLAFFLESRKNKIYIPKSKMKLSCGDSFRALSKEDQETMCRAVERKKNKS